MKIKKENKLEKYTNEEIEIILKESKSFSSVLRTFGYNSITTGNYKYVKKILRNREIEVPVYNYFNENINFNRKSNEEMFSKNSTSNRNHIKNRIIKENLMKYECEIGRAHV